MRLQVRELSYSYGTNNVLNRVSFHANEGELLSVLGPNGAGKSTLFRCILGLLQPTQGTITLDGTDLSAYSPTKLARHIAYIPQSHRPTFHYSVFDMVLMGTTAQVGQIRTPNKHHIAMAEAALERLGILDLMYRDFEQISGGEQQLVLIARAIAQQAKLLVMDEPSANLDLGNRFRVMQTVRELADEGYTVIQSTHDPEQAYRCSNRIIALHNRQIIADGTPQEVMRSELISRLYGVSVEIHSLCSDSIRICIPAT